MKLIETRLDSQPYAALPTTMPVTAEAALATLTELTTNPPTDPAVRERLHAAAREFTFALESEHDTATRVFFGGGTHASALVASDLDVFNLLAKRAGGSYTVHDLAKETNSDPVMLHRILRHLNAHGLVQETGDGLYIARRNGATANFAKQVTVAGLKHTFAACDTAYIKTPQFLKDTGYRNPENLDPSPASLVFGTEVFTYWKQNPEAAQIAQAFFSGQRQDQLSWMDQSDRLGWLRYFQMSEKDIKAGRTLMVDVGGGSGHQCIALRQKHPKLQGGLIVEDLEHAISHLDIPSLKSEYNISAIVHDFLTPQPPLARSAKVYYLRTILHGFNDEMCGKIPKILSEAMAEDSVIIIDELVVPRQGANERTVAYDFAMMTIGAMERSGEQYKILVEGVGKGVEGERGAVL
jgi:demethylsterigmatocystin 6-O-methyltransferase